ncbi:MAG: translation initiation factor 2 [Alphaproteobacteria bacterium]|nr:translation initiation factor 2 [Alphaproteobacteria bacterium]
MKAILATAGAALMLGGCATVTRGATSQVQIDSDPPGAMARTSLNHSCTTPCTIQVSRRDEFAVTFSKEGFRDERIDVKTQLAGAGAAGFAGNVLIGGVVGMGVDAVTGSTLEHVPNPVRAVLQPLPRAQPAPVTRNRRGRPTS